MANEFKVKKGLIVQGSGSTVLDIQGSQGQLFSVTDSLSGSLFSVNDISGMPIVEVFSDDRVNLGTFNAEAIKVSGSTANITGSLFGTSSYARQALSASFASTASFLNGSTTNAFVQNGNSFGATALLGTNDNQSLALETNGTTKMFISSSGNVGIGTTSPGAKLHVVGNIYNSSGTFYTDTIAGYSTSNVNLAASTNLVVPSGNVTITGSLIVTGRVTAEEFHTEFVSSSIIYQSGSTKFGDSSDDVMSVTGSLRVNGSITGSLFGTASYATQALSATSAGSATTATSASYATAAGTVTITTQDVTPVLFYLTFTGGTSGNNGLSVDTSTLTYAPNTGIFSTPIVNSTTAVRGGNGSAGAPAFSFSGDTDNGMYYIGTNSVGFSTGGTARMSIDSSGNVGVGFTSSTYKLQVSDTIATVTAYGNFAALQALGGAGYRWTLNNDSTFRLQRTTNGFSSITTPITVDSSDRVGIGTTSMVRTFQVGGFSGNPEICIGSGTTGAGALVFGDGASGNDPWRGHIIYNHSTDAMTLGTANAGWLTLTSGGALGLNVSPTNTAGRFEASNDIVAYSSSDRRWKTNIKNIDSPLEKISQINGVEFDWIEDEPVHGNKGHDIGIIAQEIEQVLPDAVQTRESGMKAVKYEKVIPLLIEAIKDQQKQIEELKQLLNGITR